MGLLYGVNQADQCWDFALGVQRERIWQLLREIDTRLVRLFLFDKGAPDPVKDWPTFEAYVQAVLNIGATPMITFAKLHRPLDDSRAVRWFANQCGDVVWGCIDRWGPEVVRDWYWCVWNEPNNEWISGPVSFEQYRRLYEAVAEQALRWLSPHLGGKRPLIGGPAVEGFQPFWLDWVWRFINEVDNSLIGFVDWHCYGDWREDGENGAPADPSLHKALLIHQVHEFEIRANAIQRLIGEKGILNICGELNCHSHYTDPVRARFNQSVFGATFYAASLLRLMRTNVHAEMFWTGTEDQGGYGMMNGAAEPWPSYHAKRLCAAYVRTGDEISFPTRGPLSDTLDAVVAHDGNGRLSAFFVHLSAGSFTYEPGQFDQRLKTCHRLIWMDEGSRGSVQEQRYDGRVAFEGYGVAVITNVPAEDA